MQDAEGPSSPSWPREEQRWERRRIAVGLGRAFGGALIFSLPMIMTMEMWWIGFYIDRFRLALLLILTIPVLALLSSHAGFQKTFDWKDDLRDAAIAYGIGILASAVVLATFGLLTFDMPLDEIVGTIAIQAVPASIGAILGRSQLGGDKTEPSDGPEEVNYGSELFLMSIGALFLGLNVEPTEEMVLISYKMTEWHAVALIVLSIVLMQGFVYAVEFHGEESLPPGTPWWSAFLRFTLVGYVLAALISLYVLWTFGRTDGMAYTEILRAVVVLGFPAAIGAAAARLIL
ncbi:TIGR02587 family membrane protein [Aurantimonas sp. C2-6-R+9]|uniref:TIGR02587 family membrane protein n=1 Tax=unclassified Aurantimonas TaxID=2638230 RepID=UPI002E18A680|nr:MULTISPECIES: TIGR02587 family membrane protein [unclassified Aurantimonas]MEC5292713.1 TIGR02587 family membrane protein [Aurantimonas sp. C2-3-R2]MEC5382932.1 TIGR02587 family membrane protein [Aurantimonas sp. C2-6-R+9]MEC5413747.1 TIGR02587 family membrane protein [Aurantimonas sp. C2-4-R8]